MKIWQGGSVRPDLTHRQKPLMHPQTPSTSRRSVLQLMAFLVGSTSGLLPALLRSGRSIAFAEDDDTFVEVAEIDDFELDEFENGVYVTEGPDGEPLMLLLIAAAEDAEGDDGAEEEEDDDELEVYALSAVCTHTGCSSQRNWRIDGEIVQCTCHGSKFSFDGEVVSGPARTALASYEVKVEDGMILVAKA